jgi:hypothetical protein
LSGKVYDEIQGRIDLTYEDLGAQQLKNIDRLVSVYRAVVRAGPETSPSPQKASLALPDRPSIAVLPFKHFFDGLRKATRNLDAVLWHALVGRGSPRPQDR